MDNKLIKKLQEEELFTPPTEGDITNRKAVRDRQKAEAEKVVRARLAKMCQEDDVPLNIVKELHEDNLAPNHAVNFSLDQWMDILAAAEVGEPGTIDDLEELQRNMEGSVMHLDNYTDPEAIAIARRNPKSRWHR